MSKDKCRPSAKDVNNVTSYGPFQMLVPSRLVIDPGFKRQGMYDLGHCAHDSRLVLPAQTLG